MGCPWHLEAYEADSDERSQHTGKSEVQLLHPVMGVAFVQLLQGGGVGPRAGPRPSDMTGLSGWLAQLWAWRERGPRSDDAGRAEFAGLHTGSISGLLEALGDGLCLSQPTFPEAGVGGAQVSHSQTPPAPRKGAWELWAPS